MKQGMPIPTEDQEQMMFVQWLCMRGIKHSFIPNSTWTPSMAQKMKNKRLGLNPGVPDLLLIVNNQCVFVEMKRTKRGVVSDEQKSWIEALSNCQGVHARVCNGAEEAITFVESLLTYGNSAKT